MNEVSEFFLNTIEDSSERIAYVSDEQVVNYLELFQQVLSVSVVLKNDGCKKGDIVGIQLKHELFENMFMFQDILY